MSDLVPVVVRALLSLGARPALDKAQRMHQVVALLDRFGLAGEVPPGDFEKLYARALVAHFYGRPGPLLRLFADQYVRAAFVASVHANDGWAGFRNELASALARNAEAGAVEFGHLPYDAFGEADGFIEVYQRLVDRSRSPAQARIENRLARVHELVKQAIESRGPSGSANGYQADLGVRARRPVRRLAATVPVPFVGRADELAVLDGWFGASGPRRPIIVHGEGGVGKSGLLAYWADRLHEHAGVEVLHFDLGGFGPVGSRKTAGDAFGAWLPLLRPGEPVPADAVVRRVRLVEAIIGQRALLIFDNVGNYQDVQPVLPDLLAACPVVIASRNPFVGSGGLAGAARLRVRPMGGGDAVELLRQVMGERLTAEPATAEPLASFCAGLPLALRVVADTAVSAADVPLTDLVDALARTHRLLDTLSHSSDDLANMRAVLSWSFDALPEKGRQAFRLLGLYPAKAATADAHAAARLFGTDIHEANRRLRQLVSVGLLERIFEPAVKDRLDPERLAHNDSVDTLWFRYRRHDLLHSFAAELAAQPEHAAEMEAARARMCQLYYDYINHAFDRQNRDNLMVDRVRRDRWRAEDPTGAALVDSAGSPFAWFERERSNFVSLAIAATDARLGITTPLVCSAFYFLEAGKHYDDWDRVEDAAAAQAHSPDIDRMHRARWLRNRGRRHLVDALDYYERLHAPGARPAAVTAACARARRLLEESTGLYRTELEETGDAQRRAAAVAGLATTLRELADVHRLEIDPDRPDNASVTRALLAYEEANARLADHADDLPGESQRNWQASFDLAFGTTHLLAAATDPTYLTTAQRLIEAGLRYASPAHPGGRSPSSRLWAFGLRRLGDLHLARDDPAQAADRYAESADVFQTRVNDILNAARSEAFQGRALSRIPARRSEAAVVLRRAAELLHANAASDEAAVVNEWDTALCSRQALPVEDAQQAPA